MRCKRLALSLVAVAFMSGHAHAAAPVRLVEAFTTPDFDRSAVIQVTPASPTQKTDPAFNVLASRLGDALTEAGLKVHQDAKSPTVYVTFEYAAYAIPYFRRVESAVNDPTYRALVVTAIAAKPWDESKTLKLLWQVALDQTGISNDADRTLPVLMKAGARYYGRNLTPKGLGAAATCAGEGGTQLGSHIVGHCSADGQTALAR